MKRKRIVYLSICVGVSIFLLAYLLFVFLTQIRPIDLNLIKTQQIIPWGTKSINAHTLWHETTGKNVRVAIMDSGVNFNHPDLNVKDGFNAIEPNCASTDSYTHGTFIAGIISAKNNNFGVVGVAPDADVYSVKVLDEYGEGEISDIKKGIDWCIENNIQVINMSFSISKNDDELHKSIKKAVDNKIVVVASAGNKEVGYPASYNEVISVASISKKYKVSDFSPSGKIDFCAPGIDVVSTADEDNYIISGGTSVAAAYVTGVIALILQTPENFGLNKEYTPKDVYLTILKYSELLGEKERYGYGKICF